MRRTRDHFLSVVMTLFVAAVFVVGCDSREENAAKSGKPVIAPGPVLDQPPATAPATSASTAGKNADGVPAGIAVEVNGKTLTKNQLDADIQKKLVLLKGQVPAENVEEAKGEIRRGIVDEFVIRTLLAGEITKRKITATQKDVDEVWNEMKARLPAGTTMEALLKENGIDAEKWREEISMSIRINKLAKEELGNKAKVADKEIGDFYRENQEKFKQPETVHARHILIRKVPGDTDKIKAEKKGKAEELRKRLVGGADFAELAAKNSDCPSKEQGGDLGFFARGQMVKPFEDAAFSQAKNEIGPVVETEFGFHIIQVLEHRSPQVAKLDSDTRKQIMAFLERQKQQDALEGVIKRLKAEANIVVYGK
jgi:peptidyl-prolyl cis-trans isomerase C